ncbi:hypothetical protein ACFCYB_00170 [Streptomyces sp. NPDC056309]|uniref:hypothetical protein n=1 Tax=Streptomyces sp. NPDC056309 TaxID=3345781 RepID=UPI0035D6CB30
MPDDSVVWLRPEYQGREEELIHLAAAADLVGVTRSALSNWANRHGNFPKIVRLMGPRERRTKWVVRDELVAFARAQLNKPRAPGKRTAPARPRAEILAARIAHHEAQIERLAELEVKHAATLKRTQAALARHRDELAGDRRKLTAETRAVTYLESN